MRHALHAPPRPAHHRQQAARPTHLAAEDEPDHGQQLLLAQHPHQQLRAGHALGQHLRVRGRASARAYAADGHAQELCAQMHKHKHNKRQCVSLSLSHACTHAQRSLTLLCVILSVGMMEAMASSTHPLSGRAGPAARCTILLQMALGARAVGAHIAGALLGAVQLVQCSWRARWHTGAVQACQPGRRMRAHTARSTRSGGTRLASSSSAAFSASLGFSACPFLTSRSASCRPLGGGEVYA